MMTGPDAERLRATLGAAAVLLESVGETFWADKARNAMKSPDADNMAWTASRWFGGMGSFNDLILCRLNGHEGSEAQLAEANQRLNDLSSEIYQLSQSASL
jgi:hypothetical protein